MDCLGLYTVLLSYRSASTGQCNPSRNTLLERTGWSESTLLRRMNTLVNKGYIARTRTGRHDAWQYSFPSLDPSPVKRLPALDPSPLKGQTPRPFTPEESRGLDPSPQTPRPFTRDAHIKEEQDVLEQEDTTTHAREGVLADPSLNSGGTDAVRQLLAGPMALFNIKEGDPRRQQRVRRWAGQFGQLLAEQQGVPLGDLLAWQAYELSDPYWSRPGHAVYNPLSRHNHSWDMWQELGRPGTYAVGQQRRAGARGAPAVQSSGSTSAAGARGRAAPRQIVGLGDPWSALTADELMARPHCRWCGAPIGGVHLDMCPHPNPVVAEQCRSTVRTPDGLVTMDVGAGE